MIVKFWGVRGSTPMPGPHTLRYGGNTSCVSLETEDRVLVLDAGTGIRALGASLLGDQREIFLLVTHLHCDHILGFPFFGPLFEKGRKVHILNYRKDGHDWSLLELLNGVQWPIRPEHLACDWVRVEDDAMAYLADHGFAVSQHPANHPGGAYGYRIEAQGRAFVYMPDNELGGLGGPPSLPEAQVAFCRDAVLCHDAQYVAGDMPAKQGWGHSLVGQACELAVAAQAEHLVLFHHDPDRTDAALDAIEAEARALLAPQGVACTAAHEGLVLHLGGC
jgi:phosphoribosyl 1,2-cyclic phosphodiesterase